MGLNDDLPVSLGETYVEPNIILDSGEYSFLKFMDPELIPYLAVYT